MIEALESYWGGFLHTQIDTEGLQQGFPIAIANTLRATTRKQLIVAGGISTREEVKELDAMTVDAVVGMAIYTGKMELT